MVYIDDIIITGSSTTELQILIAQLNVVFSLKGLGELHYFLSIEVTKNADSLHLSQRKYILDLLRKARMNRSKALHTPMVSGLQLSSKQDTPISNPQEYQSFVGALQYITVTRPRIAFIVNKVSQFMHYLLDTHFKAVKRILRYLKGTLTYGMTNKRPLHLSLVGFFNANWGSDPNDRRNMTGYCIFLVCNVAVWSSKKQHMVSRSSIEAEYRSLANDTAKIIWIQSLLQELKIVLFRQPLI